MDKWSGGRGRPMSELAPLADWLRQVSDRLDDSQRRVLLRRVGQMLKNDIKKNISAQRSPDGTPFAPRKLRRQRGKVRRGKMFAKSHRQLRVITNAERAEVGFGGRYAQIMQVHQYGQTIQPSPNARPTTYPMRETIGISDDVAQQIERLVLEFLTF